jgi:uncharacterized protein
VGKVAQILKQFRNEPGVNEQSFVINYLSSKRIAKDANSLGGIEQKLDNADPSTWEKTGNREPHNQFGIDDATNWKESDHPRAPDGKFGSGGAGGAKSESKSESRNDGETDKQFAKRVVDKRAAPEKLPEDHSKYFEMEGSTVVPLDELVSSKTDEENAQGAENGAKRMDAAAKGELSKRGPITVEKQADGKYKITDGNGTYSTVKKYGWKSLPVKIEGGTYKPGVSATGLDASDAKKKEWASASPIKTIDDLFAQASGNQAALGKVGDALAAKHGIKFANPGIKGRARTQEKVDQGKPPGRINDVVRGGFSIDKPDQGDAIVKDLAEHFEVADEGWAMTPTGYFDRKVMVRFPGGQVGEVQIWHPDLLRDKEEKGHKIYEEWRSLPNGDPRRAELELAQKSLYGQTFSGLAPEWKALFGKGANDGNLASNAAFDSTRAPIPTSMDGAGIHASLRKTHASPGRYKAGSPSHAQNVTFDISVILNSHAILQSFRRVYANDAEIAKDASPEGPYFSKWSSKPSFVLQTLIRGKPTVVIVTQGQQPSDGTVFPNMHSAKSWLRENGYGLNRAQDAKDTRPSWAMKGELPKVNNEHTVRWMTVLSHDGATMYKDRSIPDTIENNGKQLDTSQPLLRHEAAEYEWMQTMVSDFIDAHGREPDGDERKQIYLDAHKKAGNVSEKKWIEENGYDWKSWESWCRGEESRIENEHDTDPPPDVDVKPFPHSHNDLETTVTGDEKFQLALDAQSVREFDADGRLHVATTHISKATVNPYLGHEIPGWEMLGLDPNKIYFLLRDPDELRKAAPTFNGIPVLNQHVPVSAESHPKEYVIGSTGNEADFNGVYLDNSLNIWPQEDISGIESETKKELSSAYRYTPDMTPGVFQGKRYDGVMREIVGNHVAVVKEGRAGADVVVGDSNAAIKERQEAIRMANPKLSKQAAIAIGVLSSAIRPKLAADAKLNLRPIFAGVTAKNFGERKPAILAGLTKSLKGKLAQDATIGEVAELLDMIEAHGANEGMDTDKEVGPMAGKSMEAAAEPVGEPVKPQNQVATPMEGEGGGEEDELQDEEHEENEMADPAGKVEALLKGKVDDATLAQVCELMRGAPAGATDADGGEEKLKELGAADALEEDPNKGKGTGTGEGSPGGSGKNGGASDEMEDVRNDQTKADRMAKDDPPPFKGMPKVGGKMVTQDAMNAAIKAATAANTKNILQTQREVREAEKFIRPWVGDIAIACDSANDVFKAALTALNVEGVDKIHPSAYRTILELHPKPGERRASESQSSHVAMDSATVDDYDTMFPDASRIGLM